MVHIYLFYLMGKVFSIATAQAFLGAGGVVLAQEGFLGAAIAVGGVIAGTIVIGGIVYYLYRRRRVFGGNHNHQEFAQAPQQNDNNQQALQILRQHLEQNQQENNLRLQQPQAPQIIQQVPTEQQALIEPNNPIQNQQENNLPLPQSQEQLVPQPQEQVPSQSQLPINQHEEVSQSELILIPPEFEQLSSFSSATTLSSNSLKKWQLFYICPITHLLIVEPVFCTRCGKNFEEFALIKYVQRYGKCPNCRREVTQQNFMPNPDRKDEIKLFRKHLAKKMRRNQEQRIEEDGLNEV